MEVGLFIIHVTVGVLWLHQRSGRSADAMALLISAHAVFDAAQEPYGMAEALMGIAGVLNAEEASAAERAKSISYYKRALDLLDARVYRASAAQLYHNLGLAHFRAHNYPLAQQYCGERQHQHGLERAERAGDRHTGMLDGEKGQPEAAERHHRDREQEK